MGYLLAAYTTGAAITALIVFRRWPDWPLWLKLSISVFWFVAWAFFGVLALMARLAR